MWTKEHRARHEPRLKDMVSQWAEKKVARWLERADPPRSEAATPTLAVVRAIAWHLRVGGPWRGLPSHLPPWRTVYGWFRRWLLLGLFDRPMCEVAVRRRRAAGRRSTPTLAIIDTQTVTSIAVRGPRGYDPELVAEVLNYTSNLTAAIEEGLRLWLKHIKRKSR